MVIVIALLLHLLYCCLLLRWLRIVHCYCCWVLLIIVVIVVVVDFVILFWLLLLLLLIVNFVITLLHYLPRFHWITPLDYGSALRVFQFCHPVLVADYAGPRDFIHTFYVAARWVWFAFGSPPAPRARIYFTRLRVTAPARILRPAFTACCGYLPHRLPDCLRLPRCYATPPRSRAGPRAVCRALDCVTPVAARWWLLLRTLRYWRYARVTIVVIYVVVVPLLHCWLRYIVVCCAYALLIAAHWCARFCCYCCVTRYDFVPFTLFYCYCWCSWYIVLLLLPIVTLLFCWWYCVLHLLMLHCWYCYYIM